MLYHSVAHSDRCVKRTSASRLLDPPYPEFVASALKLVGDLTLLTDTRDSIFSSRLDLYRDFETPMAHLHLQLVITRVIESAFRIERSSTRLTR